MAKQKNKKHICSVCGRREFRKLRFHGVTVCERHRKQLKKYGTILDNNSRTIFDRNSYRIVGDIAIIDLYDKNCEKVAETIIDAEDIDRVKNIKWKLSAGGYAVNTPKKGKNKNLSRFVLQVDTFVDHINHNTLDNRKSNLRVVTKSQNQMNANYKGVYCYEGKRPFAKIKLHGKQICLGSYDEVDEAYYARWYAEKILFKEYRYPKPEPVISNERKRDIQQYVENKVQRLQLSTLPNNKCIGM